MRLRFYGVVDNVLGEAVELFVCRKDADRVVLDWDSDAPARAGQLRVEVVEIEAHRN